MYLRAFDGHLVHHDGESSSPSIDWKLLEVHTSSRLLVTAIVVSVESSTASRFFHPYAFRPCAGSDKGLHGCVGDDVQWSRLIQSGNGKHSAENIVLILS